MTTPLTMLVHGESGTGKSWLGDTAPTPRLILDSEGRAHYTPSEPKVQWDPMKDAPPEAGEWETCIAPIYDFDSMARVFQWLQSGQHPFKSVVIDSLMEVQKRLIDKVAGMEQLNQQDWGEVLRRLESLIRNYRDLVLSPSNTVDVIVFVVGSIDDGGIRRPLLQGQLRTTVPYFMDVVGYLYTQFDSGTQDMVRTLLVQPAPQAVAKDGTGRLGGPVIKNPSIADLYQRLNKGVNSE